MKYLLFFGAVLIIVFTLIWYVDSLAHTEIAQAVKIVVYSLSGAIVIGLVIALVAFAFVCVERVRQARAARRLMQKEADIYAIVSDTHGVFVRDLDPKATWRPLHLNPAPYQNSSTQKPTQVEIAAWQTFTLRNRALTQASQQVLLPELTPRIDLLAALDSVQRCLIVGASDTGKTTLLQWLVSRRLNSSRVVVIDPHSFPNKYPAGAVVIGMGRDYKEIARVLNALVKLMTKRYEEIGRGLVAEMAHDLITIFIDEWRAITGNLGKPAGDAIKALLTESRKSAFRVFVATHSDRAKPLGLEGEYDLKDGFVIVRLVNVNGQRQATLDTGNGEVLAVLPGPFSGSVPQVINQDSWLDVSQPEPTPTEAEVLYLYEQGRSLRDISQAVYGEGKFGQFYNDKINAILHKYGEK